MEKVNREEKTSVSDEHETMVNKKARTYNNTIH